MHLCVQLSLSFSMYTRFRVHCDLPYGSTYMVSCCGNIAYISRNPVYGCYAFIVITEGTCPFSGMHRESLQYERVFLVADTITTEL